LKSIIHIDFNSYFATIEQQANPRLRGKPIGVTGGDRDSRTVLGAASVEAKKLGVRTGMNLYDAKKVCPQIILVRGDSDKYLECTKRFLNILKNYSPYLEIFSIDEVFMEVESDPLKIALEIKDHIRKKVGEWVTVSIGISYNKRMSKLASALYKPDGLVWIQDPMAAQWILDRTELDEICGIGHRIKQRLINMGIHDFKSLRASPLSSLLSSFKSYGQILYDMARGEDKSPIVPFWEKPEIKSVGHRHTLNENTQELLKIKQVFYKLTELIARRLRSKKMVGKTVSLWTRDQNFEGIGGQTTIKPTDDGLEIYKAAFELFNNFWRRQPIRMIGISVSNLKPSKPFNLTFLEDELRQQKIIQTLDKVNDRFGEFTLKRGVLIGSQKVIRKANPFLSDRRFKI
jgi:DNA polymerase IV